MFPLTDSIQHTRLPVITWLIVALNVFCCIFTSSLSEAQLNALFRSIALVPETFLQQFGVEVGKVFASMFLHAGLGHLLGNVWFLWIFGDGVEDRIGKFRYVCLYLFCGVLAALSEVLFFPHLRVPMVGASGAIAGVLGLSCTFSQATVSTFIFAGFLSRIVQIPAPFLPRLLACYSGHLRLFRTVISGIDGVMPNRILGAIGGFIAGMVLAQMFIIQEKHDSNQFLHV